MHHSPPIRLAMGRRHGPEPGAGRLRRQRLGRRIARQPHAGARAARTAERARTQVHESYAGPLSQTDLCAPSDFVFTGMQPPPLPPECDAPAR